jgi:hypothetical protein
MEQVGVQKTKTHNTTITKARQKEKHDKQVSGICFII